MSRKMKEPVGTPPVAGSPQQTGPFDKRPPVRVGFGVYVISLIIVALIVFVVMLVQYLPGYRNSYRLSKVIQNSNVQMTVDIPMSETENRKDNPFTKEQRDKAAALLKSMEAKSASVVIQPEK
jgi:hypothetical protein